MPPKLRTLKFMGCKEEGGPGFEENVFKPAIQVLVEQGLLRNGIYAHDGELSPEYFKTRAKTPDFVEKMLVAPHDNLVVCAWYDYCHTYGYDSKLSAAGIPVANLLIAGTKSQFNADNMPNNPIWLSNEWQIATGRFVATIMSLLNPRTS